MNDVLQLTRGTAQSARGSNSATLFSMDRRILTQMLYNTLLMSSSEHIEVLVSAFKVAWNQYFQADRNRRVLECLARPALAEFLVGKVKEGIRDLPTLAAAG